MSLQIEHVITILMALAMRIFHRTEPHVSTTNITIINIDTGKQVD